MFTSFIQLVALTFLIYICIYTLVNRVCSCIEQVSIAKSFSRFKETNKESYKDYEKSFSEFSKDGGE